MPARKHFLPIPIVTKKIDQKRCVTRQIIRRCLWDKESVLAAVGTEKLSTTTTIDTHGTAVSSGQYRSTWRRYGFYFVVFGYVVRVLRTIPVSHRVPFKARSVGLLLLLENTYVVNALSK